MTVYSILGHIIQYDEDETRSLIVDLQSASLVPLLNIDTKEIIKKESNKIQ